MKTDVRMVIDGVATRGANGQPEYFSGPGLILEMLALMSPINPEAQLVRVGFSLFGFTPRNYERTESVLERRDTMLSRANHRCDCL